MQIYMMCGICDARAEDFDRGWTGTNCDNMIDVLAYILTHAHPEEEPKQV